MRTIRAAKHLAAYVSCQKKQLLYLVFYFTTHWHIAHKHDLEFIKNEYQFNPEAAPTTTISSSFLERSFDHIVRPDAIKKASVLLDAKLRESDSPFWVTNPSYYESTSPHNMPISTVAFDISDVTLENALNRLTDGQKPRYGS